MKQIIPFPFGEWQKAITLSKKYDEFEEIDLKELISEPEKHKRSKIGLFISVKSQRLWKTIKK